MSKNYNSTLQINNSSLEEIIVQLNNMPDASEGGIELPVLDNEGTANDMLAGKQLIDSNGNVVSGNIPTITQATPSISVNSTGLITTSATQTAGYVAAGTKSATKQLTTQSAKTITPSTLDQVVVAQGVYATGAVTVKGDANLVAENIVSGKSIFGVNGTAEVGAGSSNPSASKKEVNFYDYDGTILYSYTIEEAQNLTSLPELPSREGLVCQGWNYDLTTIKSYNRAVNVGAMYITDDGKTRIYIHLEEGRTSPMLGCCPNGTVIVDWGDGSTSTLTGTSISTVKWTSNHNYANAGDYVITLTVNGSMGFHGTVSTNQYSNLLRCSAGNDPRNNVYKNAIQKIEIGNNVTSIGQCAFGTCYSLASITIPNNVTGIGDYAFYKCYSLASITIPNNVTGIGSNAFLGCDSLASITIPNSVTSIGNHAFYTCYSLTSITIPNNVVSIGGSAFYDCHSLTSITIPNNVTSIGVQAFANCYGVVVYDFTSHTSVPTLSATNAFSGISSDCVIKVPAALYAEWIAATNWSTYASQIVAV